VRTVVARFSDEGGWTVPEDPVGSDDDSGFAAAASDGLLLEKPRG